EHRCGGKAGWRFECGVCGKKAGTAARLRAHERIHGALEGGAGGTGVAGGAGAAQVAQVAPARRGGAKNLECGECHKVFSTET
ncbi:ZN574 protein, partial [Cettia cetti]|nr:ZN574 protein [Cettia cetti]